MRKSLMMAGLTIIFLFHAQPGFSQTAEEIKALREEIKALKEGQKAIQKELQEIKGLLAPKPAAPVFKEAVLSIEGKPFKGNNEAKLTLIEFSEFQ
ncbi:MAG: hypothetical protein A2157_10480 [Deltaproteobacteria bacterium RBG_16_47_11]|nr:MAG: hypothetical protein A2157_10480 [Deltaproteobacteria bacterium RBG_16_47_11]